MLNAKINSRCGVTRKEKSLFSALLAPCGAAIIYERGVFVYGSANASLYAERLVMYFINEKLNCVQHNLCK